MQKGTPIFHFESFAHAARATGISRMTLRRRVQRNPNITLEEFSKPAGIGSRTHGQSETRLFKIWCRMKARCSHPSNPRYKHYAGRGIQMCQEWRESFEIFRSWALANGYQECLEIDRIDNNGNYEPNNCRWVTRKINMSNTRVNIYIQCPDGITRTLKQIAEHHNLHYGAMWSRYNNNPNITYEDLTKPMFKGLFLPQFGKTLMQIAKETGLRHKMLHGRYSRNPNITYEELIRQPKKQQNRNRNGVYTGKQRCHYMCEGQLLTKISKDTGIAINTLVYRFEKNPDITYEELTKPANPNKRR